MLNIVLIHSQPIYRTGLALLLKQGINDLTITASVSNLRELITNHKGEKVDVIVWDIHSHHAMTPGARLIKEQFPLAKILVLVSSKNAVYAALLETLGANAVLSADCDITDLYHSILQVHEKYTPPASSNHVQEPVIETQNTWLSIFESSVLRYFTKDFTDDEIAETLGTDISEIRNCRTRLLRKLCAMNNSEMIQKAFELGLIPPN